MTPLSTIVSGLHDAKVFSQNLPCALSGGTAVAVYVGEVRELSPDIDFFIYPEDSFVWEEVMGRKFEFFPHKKIFHSHKIAYSLPSGINIDFIKDSTLVPDENTKAGITFFLLDFVREKIREISFLGENVRVLPPEFIVLMKLFAGRGEDLGKFDLFDAEALLRKKELDINFFLDCARRFSKEHFDFLRTRVLDSLKKLPRFSQREILAKSLRDAEK